MHQQNNQQQQIKEHNFFDHNKVADVTKSAHFIYMWEKIYFAIKT